MDGPSAGRELSRRRFRQQHRGDRSSRPGAPLRHLVFLLLARLPRKVRKINQKTQVANATLVKVPFDLTHGRNIANQEYPADFRNRTPMIRHSGFSPATRRTR